MNVHNITVATGMSARGELELRNLHLSIRHRRSNRNNGFEPCNLH